MLPAVLELAGIACLAVAAVLVHPALAWFVVGVGLIGKALELERRSRGAGSQRRDGRRLDLPPERVTP